MCIFAHAVNNAGSILAAGLPFQIRGFNVPHPNGGVMFQPWWFNLAGLAGLAGGLLWLARAMPPLRVWPHPARSTT